MAPEAPHPERAGKRLARLLPAPVVTALRPVKQTLGAWRDEAFVRANRWGQAPPRHALRPGPVVVTGLFSDHRGLGQAARETARVLRELGFAVIEHDAGPYLFTSTRDAPAPTVEGGVWIMQLNPPEHRRILRLAQKLANAPMLRVGYWVYELPSAPADWLRARDMVHEVWAPSRYAGEALGGARHVPHPRPRFAAAAADRARFGLPESGCVFLAFADARSSLARKNPEGAIAAFSRAGLTDARLVVKLSGASDQPDAANRLMAAAAAAGCVSVMTETLSGEDLSALFASADALVSLHRSEGFGLTVAEAMARGKPAIVTDYSGVCDFVDPRACLLIPYKLVPVRDPQNVYPRPDQCWAEPDLEAAAASMRDLAGDADLRARMGAAGPAALAERLPATWSPETLGPDFLRLAQRS